jgi:hypothetical protein
MHGGAYPLTRGCWRQGDKVERQRSQYCQLVAGPAMATQASRVLRIILLVLDIVEAIMDGRQPKVLELQSLMKLFPSDWAAQRKLLGFQ